MTTDVSQADPLNLYTTHSFTDDQAYQAGLSSLVSGGALDGLSDEDKEDLLRRSRVFFFNQTYGHSISESDAKEAEERAHTTSAHTVPRDMSSTSGDPADQEVPRTLTFAELQALIDQGKTDQIPNNKHIPDALNVSSFSHTECRVFVFTRS
ncbi:hypothetical protein BC834DRAFT_76507 [Gloeopeniophorella convolvens]|nr:hypothetical protein BC834DRAFT_76507 [Gloeopeniophorella convolvens]